MTQATFDNRKTITYGGDATGIVGEIKGPNYNGELLTVDEAHYDAATGRTRVWFRYSTDPEVRAAAEVPQPDMATPQFDLPTWLVGAAGYVDVACDGCGATTRQHGISSPSKGWALCPDCLAKPGAQAKVDAKRREVHEEAKAVQRAGIEGARPDADATGSRAPVTIFIVGQANGEPGPFDGTWLVEYDPTRPGTAPDGRPLTAHIVVTTNRDQAARYPDVLTAWEEWKRESGLPYPRNAPLTAFTVAFTPEDVEETTPTVLVPWASDA
jgi:hypothetical protein